MIVNPTTSITTQPSAPTAVCAGGTAPTITGLVAAGTNLSYQWYNNGSTNSSSGGSTISSGGTGSTYAIPSVSTAGTTYYYVKVSGSCGSAVTSNAIPMIVNPTTSITTQPSSPTSVTAGATAPTLTVTATGSGTLSYQWYSNSTNNTLNSTLISNATASNYIPSVTNQGITYYYVVVSAGCGNQTSSIVNVTVNPFQGQATDYYRSVGSGDWSDNTKWQQSHDSLNWYAAGTVPSSNAAAIIILNGHKMTVNNNTWTAANLEISAGGELDINNTLTLTHKTGVLYDLNVGNSATLLLSGENTISDDGKCVLNLGPGANLIIGSSSGISTGGQSGNIRTSAATFNSGANYTYNGTSAQVTGNGLPSTLTGILNINNPAGVTLSQALTLNSPGGLTLSAGWLTPSNSHNLTLNGAVNVNVANSVNGVPQANSPFIDGPVIKSGNQSFIFPVGVAGTGCVPIGISAPASPSDAFYAQYIRSSAKSLGSVSSAIGLDHVSNCDYWTLNHVAGTSAVNVTAFWNSNNPCKNELPGYYINDLTTVVVAHFNGVNWNAFGNNGGTNGTTYAGSVTWNNVSNFSPFALGANTLDNPLPIFLDYLTAVKASGYNKITWKVACTSSWSSFDLERSYDGVNFTPIYTVTANSPTDCSLPFSYNDYNSLTGNVYYRIKMIDGNTWKVKYSEVELIKDHANVLELINIQPNPVEGDAMLKIYAPVSQNIKIVTIGMDGKEIQSQSIQVQAGENTVNMHTSVLSKGMYFVKGIFLNGQTNTINFIRR